MDVWIMDGAIADTCLQISQDSRGGESAAASSLLDDPHTDPEREVHHTLPKKIYKITKGGKKLKDNFKKE